MAIGLAQFLGGSRQAWVPTHQLRRLPSHLAPRAAQQAATPTPSLSFQPLVDGQAGPPRVVSLLAAQPPADQAARAELPLLLYLPGIDGTGLAASRQFPSLQRRFDLRVFVTPSEVSRPCH